MEHLNIKMMNAATAKSLQLCPTLCDPIDGSPPGFPVPGSLQARTLEWVATSFSNAWKWKVKVNTLNSVGLYQHHELQPTRLLHPWVFPGKNIGVGCHCLLRWWIIQVKNYESLRRDIFLIKIYKWPINTWKVLNITSDREIKIKTTMRYHFIPIISTWIKKKKNRWYHVLAET